MPTQPPDPVPAWILEARDHLILLEGLQLGRVYVAVWYEYSRAGCCYQLPTLFGPEADHFYFTLAEGIGAAPGPAPGPAPVAPPFPPAVPPTAAQLALLRALADHGPLTRKRLAARLGRTTSGAFGAALRAVADAGWAEKTRAGWRLTDAGRQAIQAGRAG